MTDSQIRAGGQIFSNKNYSTVDGTTVMGTGTATDPLRVFEGSSAFVSPTTERIIYARLTGNDLTGKGTLAKPYRTFQRAIEDAPHFVPTGTIVTVDITGIGIEPLPPDYQFPAVFAPEHLTLSEEIGGPVPLPFGVGSSFNIRAFPQPASNIPLADTAIPAGDITLVTQDPYSQLCRIKVTPARASYAADALKDKFLIVEGFGFASAVIHKSENIGPDSFIEVALDFDAYTGSNLTIMEPSATLAGTADFSAPILILNCPQIAFQGIRFTGGRLQHNGGSIAVASLCDFEGGIAANGTTVFFFALANVVRNVLTVAGGAYEAVSCFYRDCVVGIFGGPGNTFDGCVFEGCDPLGAAPLFAFNGGSYPSAGFEIVECLFRGGFSSKGAVWGNGGSTFSLQNVSIVDHPGDAITSEGPTSYMFLENVGGAGNGGVGVRVNDGSQVRVLDDATLVTGAGGDIQVGVLPVRTWVNFRGFAPIKNQYDLTTPFELNAVSGLLTPAGDALPGDNIGGSSGSRLFQRAP